MTKPAQFYRKKADEMRKLANRAPEAALRDKLMEVTVEYDRLADQAGSDAV